MLLLYLIFPEELVGRYGSKTARAGENNYIIALLQSNWSPGTNHQTRRY